MGNDLGCLAAELQADLVGRLPFDLIGDRLNLQVQELVAAQQRQLQAASLRILDFVNEGLDIADVRRVYADQFIAMLYAGQFGRHAGQGGLGAHIEDYAQCGGLRQSRHRQVFKEQFLVLAVEAQLQAFRLCLLLQQLQQSSGGAD